MLEMKKKRTANYVYNPGCLALVQVPLGVVHKLRLQQAEVGRWSKKCSLFVIVYTIENANPGGLHRWSKKVNIYIGQTTYLPPDDIC